MNSFVGILWKTFSALSNPPKRRRFVVARDNAKCKLLLQRLVHTVSPGAIVSPSRLFAVGRRRGSVGRLPPSRPVAEEEAALEIKQGGHFLGERIPPNGGLRRATERATMNVVPSAQTAAASD